MDAPLQQDLVELEIAAFQGPHIKRARIVLVAIGLLYVIFGFMSYGDVSRAQDMLDRWSAGGGNDPRLAEVQHQVSILYTAVLVVIGCGVANILLAVIAGKKTMLAFYAAVAIFATNSAVQIYASGGMLLTNLLWWLTLICLGMGFQAAFKAERLRERRQPSL